jgi:hypothetical protein
MRTKSLIQFGSGSSATSGAEVCNNASFLQSRHTGIPKMEGAKKSWGKNKYLRGQH